MLYDPQVNYILLNSEIFCIYFNYTHAVNYMALHL